MQTNPNGIKVKVSLKSFYTFCFINIQFNIGTPSAMPNNTTVEHIFMLFLLNDMEEFQVKMRY